MVWAGGIALALGGFFLVRYSIEQGWFGPGARVLLGALVALVLIAAGEWTRRREILTGGADRLAMAAKIDRQGADSGCRELRGSGIPITT